MKVQKVLDILIVLTLVASSILAAVRLARGDVEMVPAMDITNNTIDMNITVDGNDAWVNVTNDYYLNETTGLDQIFRTDTRAGSPRDVAATVGSPENADLRLNSAGFNISFNTSGSGQNLVHVNYSYFLIYSNLSGFNFSRTVLSNDQVDKIWIEYFAYLRDYRISFHSNVPLTVSNGTAEKKGTDLIFWYKDLPEYLWRPHSFFHLVTWSNDSRIECLNETVQSSLTPEHIDKIANLIINEDVTIGISEAANGFNYSLEGFFNLNDSVLWDYTPVWLWFPNNITNATATIPSGEGYYGNISCPIEESSRYGQKGFYIRIPSGWYLFNEKLTLHVQINGTISENWNDFFIVTIPVTDSSITFMLPQGARIDNYFSPFEKHEFKNTTDNRVLRFFGKCRTYGAVHIGWDPDLSYGCRLYCNLSEETNTSTKLYWDQYSRPDFVAYQLYISKKAGVLGNLVHVLADRSATEYVVTGLVPLTDYYITLQVITGGNGVIYSNQLLFQTPLTSPPHHPVELFSIKTTTSGVVLHWVLNEYLRVVRYELYQSREPGKPGELEKMIVDDFVHEYEVDGLEPNSAYYFTLKVVTDGIGNFDSNQLKVWILSVEPPAPLVPCDLFADETTSTSVTLGWSQCNDTGFSRYELYVSDAYGELGRKVEEFWASYVVQYTVTSLSPGTIYFFTLRVVTWDLRAIDSDQLSVNTSESPAIDRPRPVSLVAPASNIMSTSILLDWTNNTNQDFVEYELFESGLRGQLGIRVAIIPDNATTTRLVTGLHPNAIYYFTLRVVTSHNGSADSSQLSVTTRPGGATGRNPTTHNDSGSVLSGASDSSGPDQMLGATIALCVGIGIVCLLAGLLNPSRNRVTKNGK